MSKKWIFLDTPYLCHRAKHSTGNLSYQGDATGIIFGVLQSLSLFEDLFRTSRFVFCWDSKFSLRKEVYPKYKANREQKEYTAEEELFNIAFRKQMKYLRRTYLPMIGFKNIFIQKGMEADDIIASLALYLPDNQEAVIISSDHDLYQCIKHNVSFHNPQTCKTLTLQGFKKKYGIEPTDWCLVKALAGCSTDNVPGISGVGEITAIKYIKDELKKTSKAFNKIFNEPSSSMTLNRQLVSLPYPGTQKFHLRRDILSEEGWKQVTKKLGMKSLRNRMPFGRK